MPEGSENIASSKHDDTCNTILSPKNDYHSLLNSLNYVGEKDLGNSIFIRKRLIATGKAHAFELMSFLRNWFKTSDPAVFE